MLIHIVLRITKGMKIPRSVLLISIFSLIFLSAVFAQMIHHELTGSIFTDYSDMAGFMGKWIILGYLLDLAFVGVVIHFLRARYRKKNGLK